MGSASSSAAAPPAAPGNAACLCIAGPTASGKTAVALALAEALAREWPVEIISVDSALVYRGLDIGTAKPSPAERARVPHHLIDIIEPEERYSAARFVADARRLIGEITARGHLPLLVGGTMLYFKALFDGLDAMPAADAAVRAALDQDAARRGWPALHVELAEVDPQTAARLAPNDAQRIQRALEVWRLSGQPLSAWHRASASGEHAARQARSDITAGGASSAASTRPIGPWRPPLIALEPRERAWLHRRIGERFDAMLAAGLVDEVRRLRQRPGLDANLPSMRAVGYRQTWAALESGRLEGLAAAGSAATRQLAKRQLTWLRAMPWREVVACDAPEAVEHATAFALQRLRALQQVHVPGHDAAL
jgi:tRNA dimethylallyltransferase